MAYCTLDDLLEKISEEELIAITDDDGVGVVDTARAGRAIDDADAEIDSYCGRLYKVPFDPVPAMIRKTAVAIAVYNLFQGRHGAPDDRLRDYNNAVAFLRAAAKGDVTLGVSPAPAAPAETTAAAAKLSTRTKIFGSDTMEKY